MTSQDKASTVSDALHYVKQYSGKLVLIKIGGSLLEDPELVKQLCQDLSLLRAVGIQLILVHGGGKAINQELQLHQIPTTFIDGLRVTTPETMNIVEMVLCGKINKMLVRTLNSMGVNVAGFSGADGNLFLCDQYSEHHGHVGKISKVNKDFLQTFLAGQYYDKGIIPVIAPVGINSQGSAMNINADWAASKLASALGVTKLIYLTDAAGINDKQGGLISETSLSELGQFVEDSVVTDGMLTKVKAIMSALDEGLPKVHIIGGKRKHSLIEELFTAEGVGTVCHKDIGLKVSHENEATTELSAIWR